MRLWSKPSSRCTQATGELRWLSEARATADALLDLFWDPEGGIYTTGVDAEALLVRPRETMDNATPSASSTAALALLRLEALTGVRTYGDRARLIQRALGPLAGRAPLAFGRLLASIDLSSHPMTEVVITGDRPDLVAVAQQRFSPRSVLAWGDRGEGPLWEGRSESGADGRAYVCHDHACKAPVSSPEDLAEALLSSAGLVRHRVLERLGLGLTAGTSRNGSSRRSSIPFDTHPRLSAQTTSGGRTTSAERSATVMLMATVMPKSRSSGSEESAMTATPAIVVSADTTNALPVLAPAASMASWGSRPRRRSSR